MAGKRRTSWRAFFRARNLRTGEKVSENEILQAGISMTLQLWNGDTTERFDRIRLEDTNNAEIVTKEASRSYQVDTSGADPIGIFTCSALFASDEVTTDVEYAVLVGSAGSEIARAPLSLTAGSAYEVTREDYLGESADVIPDTT